MESEVLKDDPPGFLAQIRKRTLSPGLVQNEPAPDDNQIRRGIMKRIFYSGLVILMLAVNVSGRPIKLPVPSPWAVSTTSTSALSPSFWLWLCTGIAR